MQDDLETLYLRHVERVTQGTGEALARTGYERVVIHSGQLAPKSRFDDQDHAYKASAPFAYWADVPWPGSVIVAGQTDRATLATVREDSFWERREEPDWKLLEQAFTLRSITRLEELSASGRVAFIGEDVELAGRLGIGAGDTNPKALIEALEDLRVFKTPYEIECLARASAIAARGHQAVRGAFDAGERSELKLHLVYLGATDQDDSTTPYKNIVALGESAAVLHHVDYSRGKPAARSLLVDAGASFRGYGSDITRTHVAGEDDQAREFRALIAAMERMQQEIVAAIRPGLMFEALHDQTHRRLGQVLAEAQLIRCSAEEAVETGVTRVFFPHGLGHSLGVQVHDVGCKRTPPKKENPFLRNTREIEPGQVFTIEPGLYFIEALLAPLRQGEGAARIDWGQVERLKPFGGIRIEDDVQVLEGGGPAAVRNLTREAFAAL